MGVCPQCIESGGESDDYRGGDGGENDGPGGDEDEWVEIEECDSD